MRRTLELEEYDVKANDDGVFEIKSSILEKTVANRTENTLEMLMTAGIFPRNITKDMVYATLGRA